MLLVSCHKEMEVTSFENVTESVTLQSVVGDEAIISFTSFGTWNVTTDAVWLSLSPLSGEAGEGHNHQSLGKRIFRKLHLPNLTLLLLLVTYLYCSQK